MPGSTSGPERGVPGPCSPAAGSPTPASRPATAGPKDTGFELYRGYHGLDLNQLGRANENGPWPAGRVRGHGRPEDAGYSNPGPGALPGRLPGPGRTATGAASKMKQVNPAGQVRLGSMTGPENTGTHIPQEPPANQTLTTDGFRPAQTYRTSRTKMEGSHMPQGPAQTPNVAGPRPVQT